MKEAIWVKWILQRLIIKQEFINVGARHFFQIILPDQCRIN